MTLTTSTMEWLNYNRHRAYPMRRDEWREKASPESGLDCVLLDALAFNSDSAGGEELMLDRVVVGVSQTEVYMSYAGKEFKLTLSGGETSGEGSFECEKIAIPGSGARGASLSLSLSSHLYIKDILGEGEWELGCRVLESRIVRLTNGFGVDAVRTNGSAGVPGHVSAADASGEVVLEDGYRTSPVIYNGKVLVRVGTRFGIDPCKYPHDDDETYDCRSPLFFFCGQNAVNNGNVSLVGGAGVSVSQGRSYRVKSGTCAGKLVPCIEIKAGRELLDMYKPSAS